MFGMPLHNPFRMRAKYTPGYTHVTFKSIYDVGQQVAEKKVAASPPKKIAGEIPTVDELSVLDRYRYAAFLAMPTCKPRENAAEVSLRDKEHNDDLLAAYQLSSYLILLWLAVAAMAVSVLSLGVTMWTLVAT